MSTAITTTWADLASTLSTLTTPGEYALTISDPANIILNSYSESGSLGNLLLTYKVTGALIDLTPTNLTLASYTPDAISLFRNCSNLEKIGALPSSITNAHNMFQSCTSLTSVDTSGFINVTDTGSMFYGCTSLTSIDTSGFTSITSAISMFGGCTGLTSIDSSGFTSITSAISMFYNCNGLTSIDSSGFTSVTGAGGMFNGCTSLTSVDTSGFINVTDTDNMFKSCTGLTSIDTSRFTKVTVAESMFQSCIGLTSIDTSGFTSVTNANFMFNGCTGLTSIDTSGFTSITSATSMFQNCTNLESVILPSINPVNLLGNYNNMLFSDTSLTSIKVQFLYENSWRSILENTDQYESSSSGLSASQISNIDTLIKVFLIILSNFDQKVDVLPTEDHDYYIR